MIEYRIANNGDEEAVLNVIEVALGEYGLSLEPNGADSDVTDIKGNYLDNGGWFLVALDDNKIIGSVGIYKINDDDCEIRKMYLYPKYQGMGIGKEMMERALVAAKELRYKNMLLQTNSKLAKALPLYKKYGFVNDGCGEVCSRCDIAMIRNI